MSSSKEDTSKKLKGSHSVDDDTTVTDVSTATITTTPKKKKSSDDDLEKVPRMLFSLQSNSSKQAEEIMKMKSKSPSHEEVQEYYH